MDVIYEKITQRGHQLTEVERTVIEFILSAEEIESLKLKHIRSQLFVSNATIIRACKKLNYATFNELKYTVVHCKKGNQALSQAVCLSPLEKMQKEFIALLTRSMEKAAQDVCQLLLSTNCVHCAGIDTGEAIAASFVQEHNKHLLATNTNYLFVPITQLSTGNKLDRTVLLFGLSEQIKHFVPTIQQWRQLGIQVGLVTESLVSVDAEKELAILTKDYEPSIISPELRLATLSTLIYEMTHQVSE